MHVGKPAAVRVERQLAARPRVAVLDEGRRLAALAEAQILQPPDGQMREGVVHHQVVHVLVADAGGFERIAAGDAEGLRAGEVLHLAHHRRLHALAAAQDVHGFVGEILGPLRRDEDQRAAAIRNETALVQMERIGD